MGCCLFEWNSKNDLLFMSLYNHLHAIHAKNQLKMRQGKNVNLPSPLPPSQPATVRVDAHIAWRKNCWSHILGKGKFFGAISVSYKYKISTNLFGQLSDLTYCIIFMRKKPPLGQPRRDYSYEESNPPPLQGRCHPVNRISRGIL